MLWELFFDAFFLRLFASLLKYLKTSTSSITKHTGAICEIFFRNNIINIFFFSLYNFPYFHKLYVYGCLYLSCVRVCVFANFVQKQRTMEEKHIQYINVSICESNENIIQFVNCLFVIYFWVSRCICNFVYVGLSAMRSCDKIDVNIFHGSSYRVLFVFIYYVKFWRIDELRTRKKSFITAIFLKRSLSVCIWLFIFFFPYCSSLVSFSICQIVIQNNRSKYVHSSAMHVFDSLIHLCL